MKKNKFATGALLSLLIVSGCGASTTKISASNMQKDYQEIRKSFGTPTEITEAGGSTITSEPTEEDIKNHLTYNYSDQTYEGLDCNLVVDFKNDGYPYGISYNHTYDTDQDYNSLEQEKKKYYDVAQKLIKQYTQKYGEPNPVYSSSVDSEYVCYATWKNDGYYYSVTTDTVHFGVGIGVPRTLSD